jgi:hypothetical protein
VRTPIEYLAIVVMGDVTTQWSVLIDLVNSCADRLWYEQAQCICYKLFISLPINLSYFVISMDFFRCSLDQTNPRTHSLFSLSSYRAYFLLEHHFATGSGQS